MEHTQITYVGYDRNINALFTMHYFHCLFNPCSIHLFVVAMLVIWKQKNEKKSGEGHFELISLSTTFP